MNKIHLQANKIADHFENVRKHLVDKGLSPLQAAKIASQHHTAVLDKVSGGLLIGGGVTAGKGVEVQDNPSTVTQDNSKISQDNHTVETTTKIKATIA